MLVRAKSFGVDHMGGGRQPGDEWDHGDRPIGSWMELVEQNASPAPSEAQPIEEVSEAAAEPAGASGKRQLRNRKPKEN